MDSAAGQAVSCVMNPALNACLGAAAAVVHLAHLLDEQLIGLRSRTGLAPLPSRLASHPAAGKLD
jgi:hypothetical protein